VRERPVDATVGHSRWWKIRRTKPGSPGDGAARFFILTPSPVRHYLDGQCGPSARACMAATPLSLDPNRVLQAGEHGPLASWRHRLTKSRRPRLVHSGEVAPMSRGGRLPTPRRSPCLNEGESPWPLVRREP
jgi:hypothetical protein